MATMENLMANIMQAKNDPIRMFARVIDAIEVNTNGEVTVLNASTPMANVIEAMTAIGTAAMIENTALTRKQYKSLAQSTDELYLHMADRDFVNIFSTPASARFKVVMSISAIRSLAVAVPGVENIRKLTIPKHTQFFVDGISFVMQYPVDIIVMPHNGLTVHYGKSENSPLYSKNGNQLTTRIANIGGEQYLEIGIPVIQCKLQTTIMAVTATSGLERTIGYSDNYNYCRAYIKNEVENVWTEIRTVYNQEVYDQAVPTACITVLNASIKVTVPQIYFSNESIKDSLRIDIYSTRGPLEMVMSNFTLEAYSANWVDLDGVAVSRYVAPIETFPDRGIYSDVTINGGSLGIGFNRLRRQVINGSRDADSLIISPHQLEQTLYNNGYDLVTNIDNITNRQYLATRALPPPSNSTTITGVGCTVQTLRVNMANMFLNTNVRDNGRRVTILPKSLFKLTNGILELIPSDIVDGLTINNNLGPDALANHVNNNGYLYTPFTYLLDITTDNFDTRAYHLTKPKVVSSYYFQSNDPVGVSVGVSGYEILYKEDQSGYSLFVEIIGGQTLKTIPLGNVFTQLSIGGTTLNNRATINGVLVSSIDSSTGLPIDGKYIYRFDIDTAFDIDAANQLILTPSLKPISLSPTFDLVVILKNYLPVGATTSDIDSIVDIGAIPGYRSSDMYIGVYQDKFELHLGDSLEHLWTRSRSIVDSDMYQKYTENVPAVYTETVYERDTQGFVIIDTSADGFKPRVKFKAGTAVLDSKGQPVYRHYIGDLIFGDNGKPIIKDGDRSILRELDLVLFDGLYYFANAQPTLDYLDEVMDTIITWTNSDIPRLGGNLIDRSDLLFHPKVTIGEMSIIVDQNSIVKENAYQDLKVTYYLSKSKHANIELRKYIIDHTPSVLSAAISHNTVSQSDIVDALKVAMGDDILGVEVHGFIKDKYPIITLADASMLPCIGKRLVVQGNLTLMVEDSITVTPIAHNTAAGTSAQYK